MSDGADSKLALRRASDRSPALYKLGWYHSFAFPDGTTVEGVQSLDQLRHRWTQFPLPSDLSGKRVLDIGAWDGWFSFEAERRGANVVAIDVVAIENFLAAKNRLRSQVDYHVTNLYNIPKLGLGTFDYVFFLGVLYHVKHPMLALEIVCALTRDVAIVASAVTDGPAYAAGRREEIPSLEFYETDELGGHFDNWFGPSVATLMAMCRAVGFARVELIGLTGTTASVACFRHWPQPSEDSFFAPPPVLGHVGNNADLGINVARENDDYLTWWFTSDEPSLTRDDLEFVVGGFGCHAVWMTKRDGNGWSANTILPPGIEQGWVEARMRTKRSPFTPARRIAVDIPAQCAGELQLESVQDGTTWSTEHVSPASSHLVLWIKGLGENADRANVAVFCGGARLVVDYVSEPDGENIRQVNARLPEDAPPTLRLHATYAGVRTNERTIARAAG